VRSTEPAASDPSQEASSAAVLARESGSRRVVRHLLVFCIAVVGGFFGILGAFLTEFQAGGSLLLVVLGAPVIEEALKPTGVLLLVLLWPSMLRSRMHIAFLSACAGLVFGLIESGVYVAVYYPEGSASFVLYRFTVTPAMHTTASFLVGLGINRGLADWANGLGPMPKSTRNFYFAGVALHALYNTTAVILTLTGVVDF
jgi:RsiW-degrading membrane proteinase PrsW (M82 family)